MEAALDPLVDNGLDGLDDDLPPAVSGAPGAEGQSESTAVPLASPVDRVKEAVGRWAKLLPNATIVPVSARTVSLATSFFDFFLKRPERHRLARVSLEAS